MRRLTCNRGDFDIALCHLRRFFEVTFLIHPSSIAAVGLLLILFPVALLAQAPDVSVFSLDELPSAPSSACPQYVFVRAERGTLALNSGRLFKSDVAVPGNTSTVYVTCSGGLQLTFQPPSRSISFLLINGSPEARTFIVSGQDFLAMTHPQPVTVAGRGSASVTVTQPFDLWGVSIRHQNFSHTSFFAVDNVAVTFQSLVPPATIQFDLGINAPEKHRRVLTHKYRQDDEYPSPAQHEDGKIEIRAKVTDKSDGTPAAGRKVYFRVVDPPDESPYIPEADQQDDDNADVGNGSSVGVVTPTSATSDSDGIVSTTLTITSQYAGDNYAVEASTDALFPAGKVTRSGVLTAWKRVYVEVNKMYRKSAFLTWPAVPGDKILQVSDVRPFPNPPFDVVLVHGPAPGSESSTFSSEVVRIVGKTRVPFFNIGPFKGNLELDPDPAIPGVSGSYDGPPGSAPAGKSRDFLADAVAYVTGDRTRDFYLVSGRLVNAKFKSAFVEHVWLTDAGTTDPDLLPDQPRLVHDGVVPYVELMNQTNGWQREWMTRKWSHHVGRSGKSVIAKPNHHIVFTAARRSEPNFQLTEYAATTVAGGSNDLWLWLDRMPAGVEPEATVHELAHEWRVNPSVGTTHSGHCDVVLGAAQMMALHSSTKCTMTDDMYSESSSRDGVVGFHYWKPPAGGPVHSEYMHIRHRSEPIPQNEFVRPEPPQ